jgi:hypothetical protein
VRSSEGPEAAILAIEPLTPGYGSSEELGAEVCWVGGWQTYRVGLVVVRGGGSSVGLWANGLGGRWPVTPTGPRTGTGAGAGPSAPPGPTHRTGGGRPGAGAEAARARALGS